ncbi:unnamed protein product, partial [Rotaria magnacalcarata]
ALLIETLDLLHRLTLNIIDLLVKHNYVTMNFEYYSVLFYRLLTKQQLTSGDTFQNYGRLVVRLHLLQSKLLVSNEYCNTFTTTTSRKRIPRKTGYHQCVGYLLANSRIRLDDTYVESFLRVFSIFTNRHQIETSARRLALEEIAMMFN